MANRNFANAGKLYAMQVSPVMVTTAITIGAAGAVASFVGPLTASVALASTGIYTITLEDKYYAAISIHGSAQSPASGLSGVSSIEIQNASSTSVAATIPTITIKCLDADGAVVDPASGSVIDILAILNNSSVKS